MKLRPHRSRRVNPRLCLGPVPVFILNCNIPAHQFHVAGRFRWLSVKHPGVNFFLGECERLTERGERMMKLSWGRNGFDAIRSGVTASAGWPVGPLKSRPQHSRHCPTESRGLTAAGHRSTPIGRMSVASGKPVSGTSKVPVVEASDQDALCTPVSPATLVEVTPTLIADGGSTPPGSTRLELNATAQTPPY